MNPSQKILSEAPKRPRKKRCSDLNVAAVRAAMTRRGWGITELAAPLGVAYDTLAASFNRNLSDSSLEKLEAVFDYELSIISDLPRLALRKKCNEALGFDFDLLDKKELHGKCAALNVRDFKADDTLAVAREKLICHFAANPKLLLKSK